MTPTHPMVWEDSASPELDHMNGMPDDEFIILTIRKNINLKIKNLAYAHMWKKSNKAREPSLPNY